MMPSPGGPSDPASARLVGVVVVGLLVGLVVAGAAALAGARDATALLAAVLGGLIGTFAASMTSRGRR